MSILIKGMEMPKSCFECVCKHKFFSEMRCYEFPDFEFDGTEKFPHMEDRSHYCPLVLVSPHSGLIAPRWIPIKTRPMDEEERREWSEKLGYDIEYDEAVIYTSQLPDDGQEVLTCNRYGHITIDRFENDPDYGCCFEENGDMDGIVAWMPLPEPYKEEQK